MTIRYGTLVSPPERIKPIECKWIFKINFDIEGKIITYKAWLVAKSCKQRQIIV